MRTVLVADDDSDVRELVSITLAGAFERVLEAADGEEALALAKAERPALIILDCVMPKLSGLEVAARLGSDPATRTIPRIMLTGLHEAEAEGERASLAAWLEKPFSPLELLSCVDRIVGTG